MSETRFERFGIVKGVEARKYHGEIKNLEVKVELPSLLPMASYVSVGDDENNKIDTFNITMPIDSGVNPGDLVAMRIEVAAPNRDRFAPALEVGAESEEDTDDS